MMRLSPLEVHQNFECRVSSGIPTLIVLDERNEIITTNGRALLTKDADGKVRAPGAASAPRVTVPPVGRGAQTIQCYSS